MRVSFRSFIPFGFSFSRFHVLHRRERDVLRYGRFLVEEGLLSQESLEEITNSDLAFPPEKAPAVVFSREILSRGLAAESELLSALNRYYGTQVETLDEEASRQILTRSGSRFGGLGSLRLPIKFQLTLAVVFIIGVTLLVVSLFVLQRQQESLYQETVKTGKVSLAYFTSNAKIPLLDDNILELNAIVKEAASVEGLVYAFIVGSDGRIKGHSDVQKIGKDFEPFPESEGKAAREGEFTYFTYRNDAGIPILNLSREIAFGEKKLGQAHVGISIDFIREQIGKERTFIFLLGLVITVAGILFAILFGITFSRPIEKLVSATRQIARGNFGFQVPMKRKDELGTLAESFNYMSDELKMKSLLQETFGRYVSPGILKLILEDPERQWLKGMRSEATILFTDIRGFTAYSESTEPERIVEDLNEYFSIATRCILEYGGYVDKFIGDAVLGVFGVPATITDHGERAVRACLEMQQRFREASGNRELLGRVGIGVNSGVVVAGNLGSQVKMEYSIIGDSVNLASRLNHLAGPGDIIISRTVYDQVRDIVSAEVLPPQKVKGKSKEIEVYRVMEMRERGEEEKT